MWIVVRMIKGKHAAMLAQAVLSREGVMSKVRMVYKSKDDEENYFELLVPQSEVEDAIELLMENGMI